MLAEISVPFIAIIVSGVCIAAAIVIKKIKS